MPTTQISTVDTDIPYGDLIYWWLQLNDGQCLADLVKLGYPYERQFLAWEEVRKGRNPYFETGTGFEGYFVGKCASPEEALTSILKTSQAMLNNLFNMHRYDYRFKSRLLKALTEDHVELDTMSEWSIEFGAALARLRCNLFNNEQANAFQAETYQIIRALPPINYAEVEHRIRQHYAIARSGVLTPRLQISATQLKPPDQDAWLVAQSIGKFGHPLVREFMAYSASWSPN